MAIEIKASRRIAILILGAALSFSAACTQDERHIEAAKRIEPIAQSKAPEQDNSSANSIVRCVPIPVEHPQPDDGCFVDEQHAWAYGSWNPLRTTDGGRTWQEMRPAGDAKFPNKWTTDVYLRPSFITPTRGWLTGDNYTWQTDDGGLTWQAVFRHPSNPPHFVDAIHGWMNVSVTDSSEQSYITEDGGDTWRPCGPVRSNENHQTPGNGAYFLKPQLGWAITSQTVDRQTVEGVARTTDGGCTWTQLWMSDDHPDESYFDIYFLNRREGWLSGIYNGRLRHTTDGGRTWKDLPLPKRNMKISYVYFRNPKEGWFVHLSEGIYQTTDAGTTWRHIKKPSVSGGVDSKEGDLIPREWKGGMLIRMLGLLRSN